MSEIAGRASQKGVRIPTNRWGRMARMGGMTAGIAGNVAARGGLDWLVAVPQGADGVTYADKIDKTEAQIDWSQPSTSVDRAIRGLSPFPGAWFMHNGTRIKALHSENVPAIGAQPGTVMDDGLTIACGSGAVRLTRLQRAGKGVQDIETFLRGYDIPAGTNVEGR